MYLYVLQRRDIIFIFTIYVSCIYVCITQDIENERVMG